jgi:hypothetical protein
MAYQIDHPAPILERYRMDFPIRRISQSEARSIVDTYHYSRNVPAGKNVHFGWFLGEELYAVASYGIGANNNLPKYLAKATGLPVENRNLFELKRLARQGKKEEKTVSLSKLLAVSHRNLFKEDGIRYIVSYSDPDYNPAGGIYAASGFTLLGMTKPETDIITDRGLKIGRRTLLHWRKAHGNPTIQEACRTLNYSVAHTQPKKRWFLALDKADKLKLSSFLEVKGNDSKSS